MNPSNTQQGIDKTSATIQLPILPVKETVVFPLMSIPLVIMESEYTPLLDKAIMESEPIGIIGHKDRNITEDNGLHIFDVGTSAYVLKMLRFHDGSMRVLVQGVERFKVLKILETAPYPKAEVSIVKQAPLSEVEAEAVMRTMKDLMRDLMDKVNYLPDDIWQTIANTDDPSNLIDTIASNLKIGYDAKQFILETFDILERMRLVSSHIQREIKIIDVAKKIKEDASAEIGKSQREYILREQMKVIQRELGEGDDRTEEIESYRTQIEAVGMTEEAKETALLELDRFSRMNPAASEYTVSRTYLDWMISLPWNKSSIDMLDITEASRILDEDHYGLKEPKERILEYLSVRKLNPSIKGPILCFVGPPGVGKTSLGRSIARAMGRKFYRMSLGGVRDEAEIRGHRRTYVGAMPGRIIQALRRVQSNNPVIMMDELDKLGKDFRGDPSSALLEVLDPEQNNNFSDHYLDVNFDLSPVFFLGTANVMETIPSALLDRMEILYLPGYTDMEKLAISKQYIINREIKKNGLSPKMVKFNDEAIIKIIDDYTRESGLRNLTREVSNICRKIAKSAAEGNAEEIVITPEKVMEYLGPERFYREKSFEKPRIGVVPGLAWTSVGGEILFIEAIKMPGRNSLTLTGHIGNVMRESMQAALSFIRSRSPIWGIDPSFFESFDFHIHVPAGATPKDGPSAGIAIATALLSVITDRPVKPHLAMTGEITLRGDVLPIGGIKEKSLGAYRAGIRTVILPKHNEKDLAELPDEVKSAIRFIVVERVEEVFKIALDDKK